MNKSLSRWRKRQKIKGSEAEASLYFAVDAATEWVAPPKDFFFFFFFFVCKENFMYDYSPPFFI